MNDLTKLLQWAKTQSEDTWNIFERESLLRAQFSTQNDLKRLSTIRNFHNMLLEFINLIELHESVGKRIDLSVDEFSNLIYDWAKNSSSTYTLSSTFASLVVLCIHEHRIPSEEESVFF